MVAVVDADHFSRISKLLVDQEAISPDAALARRASCRIEVVCGPEVIQSRTAQAAALTVLRTAVRCYPGAVTLRAEDAVRAALFASPMWEGNALPERALLAGGAAAAHYVIAIGSTDAGANSLQVSFDGWTAQVAPGPGTRLAERDHCPLAGVVAGALAVSETFLHFAGIEMTATHRHVRLSLWDPGSPSSDTGPPLEHLPTRAWLAGLGHLGQAYAWAYAWLPWDGVIRPELWLVDDEQVVLANLETGLLNAKAGLGEYKTRVVSTWLAAQGIRSRIIERRLDAHFIVAAGEPRLILGGFDSNPARHLLAQAGVTLIDAGIGDQAENFDTFAVRAWPNPRTAEELWPQDASRPAIAERLARDNPAYAGLTADRCGRVQLAQRAVGVPFVGAAAAAFAWAHVLRDLHDGKHVTDLRLKLSSPADLDAYSRPSTGLDLKYIEYGTARRPPAAA